MDRASLEQQLVASQEMITQSEMRIERQLGLVEQLREKGLATEAEIAVLHELRKAHAITIAARDRVVRQLDQAVPSPDGALSRRCRS